MELEVKMDTDLNIVYIDGACRNNGQKTQKEDVFWGDYHPLNTYECLIGEKQTNNRAELSAAIIALCQAKQIGLKRITIYTDSKYVKEGITRWISSWKENSLKTKQKGDVLNKDLWGLMDDLKSGIDVEWNWVESHLDNIRNEIADALAKDGISSKTVIGKILSFKPGKK